MALEIKWYQEGVYVRFYDKVKTIEIIQTTLKLYGDYRFDTAHYRIYDFLDVTDISIDYPDINVIYFLDKTATTWKSKLKVGVISANSSIITFTEKWKDLLKDTGWICEYFINKIDATRWASKNKLNQLIQT